VKMTRNETRAGVLTIGSNALERSITGATPPRSTVGIDGKDVSFTATPSRLVGGEQEYGLLLVVVNRV